MKRAGTQNGNILTLSTPIPVDTLAGKRSLLAINLETKMVQIRTAGGKDWTDFNTGLLADSRNEVRESFGLTF